MVLIVAERCRDVVLTGEVAESFRRLVDRATAVSDLAVPDHDYSGDRVTVRVCSIYEKVWIEAARILAELTDLDGEFEVEGHDKILALAVRGLLRVVGIHALARLRPGGGTSRWDVASVRERVSSLSLLVSYD